SSASASKDEATRQASAAKGSATTASTKATEAAGSATAASQSKTAAESAATRAEAAADRAEEIAGAVAMEDASLTTKGVVKLSSAVDSTSESLAATPKAVKAANDNANSRVPSNRKVNGKALTADITLTPKDIGTLNSVTMSFSGGAGWFKLATVTMPQASSIVYIALIGGAGYNVGSPHQAGISELVLRAGNGNPKGITGALWKRTAVGLTNFAWINTSGDTYDIYVEIGNYATSVNIHWDCTANATVSIYTSPTYSASKPSSVTDGVVYTMYSTHQKPTPLDIGALPTTGGTVSGPLSVTGGITGTLNGNASTATKLQTARSIGGVGFDGSANINLPGVNTTGNQNTTGNAATATKLQTARTIGGVSFDGTANINLPGVNTTGNQNTTGNAATATKLQTARTINGIAFDGTRNISLGPADIGCPASPTGWLTTGSNGGAITTAQLVTLLQNNGAFTTRSWIARCAWAYANSATIPNSETGCGVIPLAGAVIEVFNNGSSSNNYTIRITTATTTSVSGALTNAEFIYVFNGTDYSPGWRRVYNTKNKPTASDVGALPLTGGTLSGGLTSSGEIISKYANGFRIAYGSFGFFIRNDGSNTYFMLTASGDTLGSWNGLRPITINNTSGAVSIGNGLNVTGGINGSLNGNAATATKLQTARTIGGVSFDGSANINLPGVNIAGNQNTTGNAATATKLQTARTINGVSFDGSKNIELTPRSIGTINSATMSFSGGAGWFKLATVTMPQASSVVYISLIGGAGFNVGSPQQAGISELVLRAGNGNPKGITGALWRRTSVGFTNFAWVNTSGDTYDIYVEIGNYATGVNIQWDYTSNASVTIHTSPTYTANKPTGLTDGTVYVIYSSHIKPTAADVGALSLSGGQLNGALGIGTSSALGGNSIVLGDNDTGFKQNGDGILDVYANSAHVFRFVNSTLQSLKPLSVTGDITSSAWVYANRFSINSGSGAWIDMRNQNVIFGRNAVSTSSAQALLRQDHADRKFFLGGLGNSQFGFYMINNSRTANGTDANAYLQNDGTWVCGGNGSFNDVYIRSDRRSKRNIRKIERALDKLDRIEGVLYEIQVCDRYEQSGGLIAQDVQNVQPELVTVDHNDQSGEPRLRLNYNGVIGMLVEAVKELREEVRELKAKM
ncbi:TPA: tail fiber protein, partial [Escherichia coli]